MISRRLAIGLAALGVLGALPHAASMQAPPGVTITLVRWPFT